MAPIPGGCKQLTSRSAAPQPTLLSPSTCRISARSDCAAASAGAALPATAARRCCTRGYCSLQAEEEQGIPAGHQWVGGPATQGKIGSLSAEHANTQQQQRTWHGGAPSCQLATEQPQALQLHKGGRAHLRKRRRWWVSRSSSLLVCSSWADVSAALAPTSCVGQLTTKFDQKGPRGQGEGCLRFLRPPSPAFRPQPQAPPQVHVAHPPAALPPRQLRSPPAPRSTAADSPAAHHTTRRAASWAAAAPPPPAAARRSAHRGREGRAAAVEIAWGAGRASV